MIRLPCFPPPIEMGVRGPIERGCGGPGKRAGETGKRVSSIYLIIHTLKGQYLLVITLKMRGKNV